MKNILAAASLLVAVAVLAGSTKPPKPKLRSLKSLIAIAMSEGKPVDCDADTVNELEFGSEAMTDGSLKTKDISYKQTIAPDHHKHIFSVAYVIDPTKGAPKPFDLVWAVFATKTEGDMIMAEGHVLRVSLDGKLKKALWFDGPVGEGAHKKLDVDSPETQAIFQKEIDFYTRDSLALAMTKK